MRILLVGDYPPDERLGSTKVLFKLQEELRGLGCTCDLLLSDSLGPFPGNGYARQALGPVVALRAVTKAIRAHGKYDVIDVASAEGAWIARLRGQVGQAAVVSRSNGLEHLNYRRMLEDAAAGLARKPWTRRLFHPAVRLTQVASAARHADRLLVLNDRDREFVLSRGWKRDGEVDIVPHGVSSGFLQSAPPSDHSRGRGILFCGSWTPVKGTVYLAQAFDRLVQRGVRVHLTILGGAVDPAIIQSAFDPRSRALLTILDRAPEAEVMAAYRTHDVLAWSSTYEGFGMVVVEAMSQRLPVVATPVGCAATLIDSGVSGVLVPPRDPDALADGLERMLQDAELRARCGERAYKTVAGMTWSETARRTIDVYARALEQRARVH